MRHRHRIFKKLRETNPYHGFRGVYFREWRRFLADGPQKILLLAVAPVFTWFFCAIYGNGTISDIPVAILDNDHSALSRAMTRSIDATKLLQVVARVNSIEELRNGMASGAFAAGFVFPQRMQADVKSGRQAYPQLYCNGTSYLTASYVIRDAQTVARTINAGLAKTRLVKSGIPEARALALVSPIVVDMSNLYNPTMTYNNFLSPGLIFAQLGTMFLFAGAVCFARERERNTLSSLRRRAASSSFAALHGKSLPYALCFTVLCGIALFLLLPLYHIGSIDCLAKAIPGLILFFAASWWYGALIGTVVGRVMVAASVSIGIGMPSFLFSGWTFPLHAAPTLYSWIAAALPFPHLMPIWFNTVEKGFGPFFPLSELLILFAMAIVACVGTKMLLIFFWNKASHKEARHA